MRSCCFSIYSFDFLVDEDVKPWLVNINTSPSLNSVSPIDKRIKTMLVCDAMTLIGIRPYHKAKVHAQSLDKLQLCSFQRSQSLQQLQKLGEFLGDE